MSRLLAAYPDAPPDVLAKLAEALRECEAFPIPPVSFASFKASMDSAAARKAWRLANPELSTAYDQACAKVDRLEKEAEAPRLEVIERELIRCGVPDAVLAAVRAADTTKEALAGARDWAATPRADRPPMLLLTGVTGVGKSVAAAWIGTRFAASRRWWQGQPSGVNPRSAFVWLHGPTLSATSLVFGELETLLERASTAELLVVDELEVAGGKAGLLHMTSLLTRRFDGGRFTVITTNAGREQLAEGLGSHVADRLLSSRVVAIKQAHSMRRKAKAKGG